MARTNDIIMQGGDRDRSEPENFKWECIGRSNRNCLRRHDQMAGDQRPMEPTQSQILDELRQRECVESIKFTIVAVALLGVLCGAVVVYILDNGDAYQDVEPIHYHQYNSYFLGFLRVTKVDGKSPNKVSQIQINMIVPEILQTFGQYLFTASDWTYSTFYSLRNLWNGHRGCECPKRPM